MKRTIWTTAFMTALMAASTSAGEPSLEETVAKQFGPHIEKNKLIGVSVGVILNGKQLTVHSGRCRAEAAQPDDDTLYEIGSVSKVFTGLMLAELCVSEKLDVNQAAQTLAPDGMTFPVGEGREITLLDLATHRSGLPRISNNMPKLFSKNPYEGYTSKLATEFLNKHKLRRKPGDMYEYSNFGMSLAGYLVGVRRGLSYDEVLAERICGPLKMTSTRVKLSDEDMKRLAQPHFPNGEATLPWDFDDLPGAGGIRSSTKDMLRFAQANLDPGSSSIGPAIELAWKQHAEDAPPMGLGWHLSRDGHTRWHNGQTGGSHSLLMVDREKRVAMVVLTNTGTGLVDRLGLEVWKAIQAKAEVTESE